MGGRHRGAAGPAWFGTAAKLGYIVVVRLIETVLGNVFIWAGSPFYDDYDDAPSCRASRPADQGLAGTIMMIEGSLVTLGAIAWLFLRWGAESELRQQLLEQGVDERPYSAQCATGAERNCGTHAEITWYCAPRASITSTSSSRRSSAACLLP